MVSKIFTIGALLFCMVAPPAWSNPNPWGWGLELGPSLISISEVGKVREIIGPRNSLDGERIKIPVKASNKRLLVSARIFGRYRANTKVDLLTKVGYAQQGFSFKATDSYLKRVRKNPADKIAVRFDVHRLDITLPIVALYPWGREVGCAFFLGLKSHFVLYTDEKSWYLDNKKFDETGKHAVHKWNLGLVTGVSYHWQNSGWFIGSNYELFARDMFNNSLNKERAIADRPHHASGDIGGGGTMKHAMRMKATQESIPHGFHFFIGYDFLGQDMQKMTSHEDQ